VKTYIALWRAVNVAGRNMVSMRDLCGMLEGLGMEDVRSLLQSGNVVFRSKSSSAQAVERLIERESQSRIGFETDVFVRSARDWQQIVAHNPFPREAAEDPGHLLMMCLKEAPPRGAADALQRTIVGREVVRTWGAHAYIVYPDGVGRSRLTAVAIEKGLGSRGTGRNWNTVSKLAALGRSEV